MKITRILLLGSLLAAFAAPVLANEEPIVYTVKPGDTLWGISKRFIKDPHYWPNLWSHNPAIGNPHQIYPGQTLYIYDGRIEIVPVASPADTAARTGDQDGSELAGEAVGLVDVNVHGGARSFISAEEVPTLGTLIDTTENRAMLYERDTIFLEMDDLAAVTPGQQLELLEIGKEVVHPITKAVIGYQVSQMGFAEVTELTADVAVAVIKKSIREVQRGARVRPYVKIPATIQKKTATVDLQGYIVAADEGNVALSNRNVIHVDLGAADGLEVGNELTLYRQRTFTKSARPIKQLNPDNFVALPEIDLGKATVIAVGDKTAAALVTAITPLPLYRGDHVKTVIE